MAKAIMVQGTMSNAGKSLITAGLCRVFKQDGYRVVPFKSQNMALNSFITKDGYEMGRAQVMQSEAAGVEPDVRMNPILLKPTSDSGSQVIVNGKSIGNMSAKNYFAYKHNLVDEVMKAYNSLADENDIIVIEGAGSPAEINLKSEDIVNMGMAKMAKAPVLLVGDIDRGGVFASLYGTVMLVDEDERDLIKGLIINKFRGDVDILKPGLLMLEDLAKKNVLGVVPYAKLDIDDEDSLSERISNNNGVSLINIAVIRLPRLSNFTDFAPFERMDGVSVNYTSDAKDILAADMVIIPGSKNTIDDLMWMRQNGIEAEIKKYASNGGVVFGICGGYQMMGTVLSDPMGVEGGGDAEGIGLLDTKTTFLNDKVTVQVQGSFGKVDGVLSALNDVAFSGYEIHMGDTEISDKATALTTIKRDGIEILDGAQNENCYGSYVHGIFDNENVAKIIVSSLLKRKGLDDNDVSAFDTDKYKQTQYDILADTVRNSLDMKEIYRILEEGV